MIEKRLKELRKSRGLTQEELANSIGITKNFVTMVESGKRKPSYEVLDKIADYFDVSTDYLLGRTNILRLSKESNIPIEYVELYEEWAEKGMTPKEIKETWE